jgi:PTH1 family peptidyl-tRNA hydrolase
VKKFLITGLGNPGTEYENTRHNIGFKVLDALAGASNIFFASQRYAQRAEFKLKGRTFVLIKPTTFMNLTGKAVRYWMETEKVALENTLIVTDDIALPYGTLRMRTKGSDGGHNGLKDIIAVLGTTSFTRLRIGIGNEFNRGQQVDYVLGEWSVAEKGDLADVMKRAGEMVVSFGLAGPQNTMNAYNG